MKTLILTTTMVAATFGFARCVAGEGVVTAAKPTKSVLKSASPRYVARAQDATRAQVHVPAETPSTAAVEPAPQFPYLYGGHGYAAGGDPFAGTWWQGFWSEKHHGQSCWGGPHGGGGGGGHGGRCGKFGAGCGKFAMGGVALGKCGRCGRSGRHCGGCNECVDCSREHQDAPEHQDAVPQPEPDLDSYFEPMDPPGFDGGASDVAPVEPPPMPEAPRRLSPPRNVLPKNATEKTVPSIDTAAKKIGSAVTRHEVQQTSAGTVLRFRGAPVARPVMLEPKTKTADLLFRQTVR